MEWNPSLGHRLLAEELKGSPLGDKELKLQSELQIRCIRTVLPMILVPGTTKGALAALSKQQEDAFQNLIDYANDESPGYSKLLGLTAFTKNYCQLDDGGVAFKPHTSKSSEHVFTPMFSGVHQMKDLVTMSPADQNKALEMNKYHRAVVGAFEKYKEYIRTGMDHTSQQNSENITRLLGEIHSLRKQCDDKTIESSSAWRKNGTDAHNALANIVSVVTSANETIKETVKSSNETVNSAHEASKVHGNANVANSETIQMMASRAFGNSDALNAALTEQLTEQRTTTKQFLESIIKKLHDVLGKANSQAIPKNQLMLQMQVNDLLSDVKYKVQTATNESLESHAADASSIAQQTDGDGGYSGSEEYGSEAE